MTGITESELDLLMLVILLLIALASLSGMLPILGEIMPSMTMGLYRVIDMIKDQIGILKYL